MTLPIHDPLLIFSIVMLNVLIAPIIAEKLKLPGILGLIISGVIFGPHLFGIIERDATINLFGTIGILYIMFQAGLEINLSEVKRNKHHSILFGLLTFGIPLSLGILGAYYILKLNILQSILLASMFSSHTLLTFPIVTKMGLSKRSEVSTTIGGTIITDTLALLILAVVVKMYKGTVDTSFWIVLVISITIYTLMIIFVFPKITRWFFKKYANENGIEEYVFVFTFLFFISYLAHIAGLEPIIGAFLVGLSLNKLIPEKSILMNRIHFVGNSLFIPYFLISVGMIIEPKAFISNIYTLKVSALMIVIALISKYLAAEIFGKFVKYEKAQRSLMFGLSVNQAAATLAAVLIGYELGIFDDSILSGTIMMIIFTTFAGAFATNNAIKKILSKAKKGTKNKEEKLSQRVLLAINNSENVNSMGDLSFYLSDENNKEAIYPLNVVFEGDSFEEDIERSEELLTKILLKGVSSNKNVIPLTKIDNNISNAIAKTCKEYRISKVVLGYSKKNRLKNIFYGNSYAHYLKNSKEMVFVSRIIDKLDLSRNVFLILPPFVSMQKSYVNTLAEVLKLSKTLNDNLTIFADDKSIMDTKEILKNEKKLEISYISIESYKNLHEDLKKHIKNNDLIIQICSRPNEISWRLDFEKLSEKIPEIFSKNSFIALYPYLHEENDSDIEDFFINDDFIKNIKNDNFILNNKNTDLELIVDDFIRKNTPSYAFYLKSLIKEESISLSHDILLYHTHVFSVNEPEFILISNKKGLLINNQNYKLIILLLSPKSLELKAHLALLSEVAKFTKNSKKLELLYNASSYEEFIDNLNKISS